MAFANQFWVVFLVALTWNGGASARDISQQKTEPEDKNLYWLIPEDIEALDTSTGKNINRQFPIPYINLLLIYK